MAKPPNPNGPAWIPRGCPVCGGDLYEADTERASQFFECLLCNREYVREVGTNRMPRPVEMVVGPKVRRKRRDPSY